MPISKSRIPGSINLFDHYMVTVRGYMHDGNPVTNADRLGITNTEQQTLDALCDEWIPLYALYQNKRSSRTLLVTDQLHAIIQRTKSYDKEHHILDRVAASPNVTITDLSTFNIKSDSLSKQNRTKPSKPIELQVVPEIKQIGGGELSIKCNNNFDARTAIVEDANEVEFRYLVGNEAPQSMNDPMLNQEASTKARFILKLGAENSGKTAYLYFRWYNSHYPELAGPWTTLQTALIV